jgi:hypothetical protein
MLLKSVHFHGLCIWSLKKCVAETEFLSTKSALCGCFYDASGPFRFAPAEAGACLPMLYTALQKNETKSRHIATSTLDIRSSSSFHFFSAMLRLKVKSEADLERTYGTERVLRAKTYEDSEMLQCLRADFSKAVVSSWSTG